MTLTALTLHCLKYLNSQSQPVSTGIIKSKMLGHKNIPGDDVLQDLKNKHFADIENDKIKITEAGKIFLESLREKELEKIQTLVFEDYDLALVGFLFNRNDFVNLEDFPDILKKCAPQHGNSVNDGNLMQSLFRLEKYIDEQYKWYIINDIGKAYYKNKIGDYYQRTTQDAATNKEPSEHGGDGSVKTNMAIPRLTEPERLWLTELYQFTKRGKRFTYRDLWAKLAEKLPHNFKTAAVDQKLISSNGERIHVLGVIAVEKSLQVIHQINTIVNTIRELILKDEKIQEISIEDIAKVCTLKAGEVSFCLQLASYYLNLYNKSSYKQDSTELISIDVSGSESIFYNYLHFVGIEYYLTKSNSEQNTTSQEYFSQDEKSALNEKLDYVMSQLDKIMLSQEFSYNDAMEEFNELKTLYGLKKKNWKRLFVAKVTEMTAEGVAGAMIFDPFADILKAEVNKFLTH